jgi:uncharacterized protein YjbJ (UPF0337 family)
MNRDQIKGKWDELKGKFKKESGNVRHDRIDQLKGAVQGKGGQLRQGLGNAEEEADRQARREEP